MTKRFNVVLQQGEDGMIVASCPALPGAWTQGVTSDGALANAREAIELAVENVEGSPHEVPHD